MKVIGSGSESVIIHHNGDNVEIRYSYGQDPYQIARNSPDHSEPVSATDILCGYGLPISATDKVGMSKLIATIKQTMSNVMGSFIGDFNDKITRTKASLIMNRNLSDMAAMGKIQNYWRVICDETNNDPNIINKNQLQMDVVIQPSKSMEYINLNGILSMKNESLKTTENCI